MFMHRALLALGLLARGAMAQGTCPSTIRLLFKPFPEAVTPGKSLKATYTLSNKSGLRITTSAVTIMLPDQVTYASSDSKRMGGAGTLNSRENAVEWADGGSINAGKSKTFSAAMTVGQGAQVLTFDAAAALMLSDGSTCTVEAPHSAVRAKGYKLAIPGVATAQAGRVSISYSLAAQLDAGAAPSGYVEYVHLQAEGYEIVSACWTPAGDANKRAALTAALKVQNNADIQYAIFIRETANETPLVAPTAWYGRCDGNLAPNNRNYVPLSYINTGVTPFVDEWCVADIMSGSSKNPTNDYIRRELYVTNAQGGQFTVEGEDSVWLATNILPDDEAVCYPFGTVNYTPSSA